MADLYTAMNEILGVKDGITGVRYYLNHATGSAPGAGAPWQLTIKRKLESEPPVPSDDPDNDFPGAYFAYVGDMPATRLAGQQYEVMFSIRVYYIGKATANTRPRELAREYVTKITDNVMASDKLGLAYISSLEWAGFEQTDVTRFLPLLHPEYWAAASRFVVRASVTF